MSNHRGVHDALPQQSYDDEVSAFLFGPGPSSSASLVKKRKNTASTAKVTHTTSDKKSKQNNASYILSDDTEVSIGSISTSPPPINVKSQSKPIKPSTTTIQNIDKDTDPFAVSIAKDEAKLETDKKNNALQKGFSQLGISSWLVSTLSKLRIIIPTDIQVKCLPSVFQGHNVIARAKTGSGKTAAFALPILEQLSHDPYGIYALVLTPTRELALQIEDQFKIFGSPIGIQTCCVIGGIDMIKQAQEIENRPHVIIATPGRLSDLLVRGSIANFGTKHLKYLVLDEADRLFEECFKPFLHTILDYIPDIDNRRTLLFSATITQEMLQSQLENDLYHRLIKNPVYHSTTNTDDDNLVETLTQKFCFFPQTVKEAYIYYLLQFASTAANKVAREKRQQESQNIEPKKLKKTQSNQKGQNDASDKDGVSTIKYAPHEDPNHPTRNHQSCIVFTKTVKTAQFLSLFLTEMKIPNVALHSGVRQAQRTENLNRFRVGGVKVLVATDIAARGLDIPSVSLVLNYDLPFSPSDYIHRVGRTARANRDGLALSFVTQYDIEKLQLIETSVGVKLTQFEIEESNVIENLKVINEKKRYCHVILEEQLERKQ